MTTRDSDTGDGSESTSETTRKTDPRYPSQTGIVKDLEPPSEEFKQEWNDQLEQAFRAGVTEGADDLLDELVSEMVDERERLTEQIEALKREQSDAAEGDLENAKGQRMQLAAIFHFLESRGYDPVDD